MCGRYSLKVKIEDLVDEYNIGVVTDLDQVDEITRWNVAPTQYMPIITEREGERELRIMRWGLVPAWMKPKNEKIPPGWINARSETIAEKPAFRGAYRHRRCLVPTTGFYEWQKREGGPKQPYWIRARGDGLLTMAGVWECWSAPDGSEIDTYTILTTSPNEVMRPIHDRMPVVLAHDEQRRWFDGDAGVMRACPDEAVYATAVQTTINSARRDEAPVPT